MNSALLERGCCADRRLFIAQGKVLKGVARWEWGAGRAGHEASQRSRERARAPETADLAGRGAARLLVVQTEMEARTAEIALLASATGSAPQLRRTTAPCCERCGMAMTTFACPFATRAGAGCSRRISGPLATGRTSVSRRLKEKSALKLRLYIAGNAPNSLGAIENPLRLFARTALLTGMSSRSWTCSSEPSRALADGIIVTPTLLRLLTAPGAAPHRQSQRCIAAQALAGERLMARTSAPLRALEQQLSEAQSTIAALLTEQIDAVYDLRSNTPVLLGNAQQALRESEERAQHYLDSATVMLVALDIDGKIVLANRYACSVLGGAASDLIGRDWVRACVPPRLWDASRTILRDIAAGDVSVNENSIVTATGEERLIEWRSTVRRDSHGAFEGTLSSGIDITERRRPRGAAPAGVEDGSGRPAGLGSRARLQQSPHRDHRIRRTRNRRRHSPTRVMWRS